jgi:phosphopantetheinyl transferase
LGLYASITRSSGVVGVVLADQPVGIDIEKVSLAPALKGAMDCWLSPEERDCGVEDLVCRWATKEAVSKLVGMGLAIPFTEIDLLPRRDDDFSTRVRIGTSTRALMLLDLAVGPESRGCLALQAYRACTPVMRIIGR